MNENQSPVIFHAHASPVGYIVFGVLYLPICALYLLILFMGKMHGKEYSVLFPWLLLAPTYLWLGGFKIRITETTFEYRDGLWRWHSCLRKDISGTEFRWLKFSNFGRVLKFPRLVILRRDCPKGPIAINPKPFSRESLERIQQILNRQTPPGTDCEDC
jgi:hypothetical protein